jgi:hypothetical protein
MRLRSSQRAAAAAAAAARASSSDVGPRPRSARSVRRKASIGPCGRTEPRAGTQALETTNARSTKKAEMGPHGAAQYSCQPIAGLCVYDM